MGPSRFARGRWVEDQVAAWLQARDLEIIERNYRIPGGELDIIGKDPDGVLVVVEVRSRGKAQPGVPEETLSDSKQSLIRRAATRWLLERDLWEKVPVRFDVVAVDTHEVEGELELGEVRWIQNAFDGQSRR